MNVLSHSITHLPGCLKSLTSSLGPTQTIARIRRITYMSDSSSFLDSLKSSLQEEQAPKRRKTTPEKSEAFGFTEINKFEHCARTLQKHIRTIINAAPSSEELAEIVNDKNGDKRVRQEVEANALLQMVGKLKSLHNANKLPLFDEILTNEFRDGRTSTGLSGARREGSQAKPKVQVDPINVKEGLPELPEIKDPQLKARVFQHKSLATHKTYLDESEIILAHNERIEFLGDSVLNTMTTYILYERYPTAPEGQLSQLRALLVNNRTLAEFALKYGFDKNLRCNIDESALGMGNQKIYADVFEAYLGALAMERGYDLREVQEWLASLMEFKLVQFEVENKHNTPINKDAKTELYSLIGSASRHPVYKVTQNGNGLRHPYKVQCVIGDVVIGEGVAPNFRDAGLRAAMKALTNKAMLEKFGRERLETDRSESVKKSGDIGGITLPIVADASVFPSKLARNEVYAHFGKTYGISPEYKVEYEEEHNRYKAELLVGDKVVTVAYDALKKNAISRAAMVLLQNQSALHNIIGMIV